MMRMKIRRFLGFGIRVSIARTLDSVRGDFPLPIDPTID